MYPRDRALNKTEELPAHGNLGLLGQKDKKTKKKKKKKAVANMLDKRKEGNMIP